MAKFLMQELILPGDPITARLGAGTGSANWIDDKEVGKPVKYVAESRYDLCAAGDPIEGRINAVEAATMDNYSIGSVQQKGRLQVTFDGLQATPGTGTVTVGGFVVTGTVVAKGTALTAGVPMKVTLATQQPGVTEAGAVTDVNDQLKVALYAWRVVSLGSAGTGAVGTVGVVERV
jgi:hypothetical protein